MLIIVQCTFKMLNNLFQSIFIYCSPANTQPPSPERYLSDTEVNYQSEADHRKEKSGNQITWNWGSLPQVNLWFFL